MNFSTTLDYKSFVLNALYSIIKFALKKVENNKKDVDNYFCISFYSNHHGVTIPNYVREKHPGEINIFLQHQFYDLKVFEHYFQVKLSFYGELEEVIIPFDAITSFIDPVANIEIQCNEHALGIICNQNKKENTIYDGNYDSYEDILYHNKKNKSSNNKKSYNFNIKNDENNAKSNFYCEIWSILKDDIKNDIDNKKTRIDNKNNNEKIIPISKYVKYRSKPFIDTDDDKI
ncbi:ClpXP protease specificity-enhancing factor SspB [Lyticum sinuosum]|uniref:Stringent starvation protein B domain protein n=1 Tax=Lyticum sinuosum TaxID=1332059 RepID=A0AAE4VKH7_9RICK|nr:ClpXP protease specificity-enhancing factor SspB [Lyticum sinuosum]MDZ5761018.1 Stringent starvation protein B domain protein [Lyticum sinuosum]